MDIWGPTPVQAISGYQYVLTIVDDATRWYEIFTIRQKNDALVKYIQYTARIFTYHGKKVKFLQSDNDTVFLDKDF